MYCSNCGAKLNDGAKFCHACGKPISSVSAVETVPPLPDPEPVLLRIERARSGVGVAVGVDIFIDDDPAGSVKYGSEIYVYVLPGRHTISTVMNVGRRTTDTIFIPDDATEAEYVFRISGLDAHSERVRFYANGTAPADNPAPAQASYYPAASTRSRGPGKVCPRCGGSMAIQTVTEGKPAGCGTILLYILLAITVLGLLIVIPLALRNKTRTVTYSVCQNCGYRNKIGRL